MCTSFNTVSSATSQIPLCNLILEIIHKLVKFFFVSLRTSKKGLEGKDEKGGRGGKGQKKRTKGKDEKEMIGRKGQVGGTRRKANVEEDEKKTDAEKRTRRKGRGGKRKGLRGRG